MHHCGNTLRQGNKTLGTYFTQLNEGHIRRLRFISSFIVHIKVHDLRMKSCFGISSTKSQ